MTLHDWELLTVFHRNLDLHLFTVLHNLAFLFMLDLVLGHTLLLVVGIAFLLVVSLVHGLALLVGAVVVEFLGKMELAAQSVMALGVVVKLAGEELAGQTAGVVTTVTKTVTQAVVTLKGNSTGESSDSTNHEERLHCKELLCCCFRTWYRAL